MAILIPSKGACLPRMTLGEKRLAERLEDKLDDDYLLWYDVPVGPQQLHPDFIVLHPMWGQYDDAQSMNERGRKKNFSFKSVGIQAQGRTTILKINYRNTRQCLQLAHCMAGDMLKPAAAEGGDDDVIPLLQPLSCGRDGPEPIVIDLPTLPDRTAKVAELLADQHAQGHAWGDLAVLCRHYKEMEECAAALARNKLPHSMRKRSGDYRPEEDAIQVMTMYAIKGLEWPVVAVFRNVAGNSS